MTVVARRRATRRPDRGQRGLTLVELMISMVLTTILVGMVFSMFIQMSSAFRTQSQVSELQQGLVAAETMVMRDVRQAGFLISNGFKIAGDTDFHQAIEVINENDAPDEIHAFYADPTAQARVLTFEVGSGALNVDDSDRFVENDLAIVVDPRAPPPGVSNPPQEFDACVVKIIDVTATVLTLDTAAPWGAAGNPQCASVLASNVIAPADTMVYRFAMRGYRIDPDRKDLSVLQRSRSAGIDDDWEDMGIGFTDLQVATRWLEPGDLLDTDDDDDDEEKDWYSAEDQEDLTAPDPAAPTKFPIEVTVSFVIRSTRAVKGVVSDGTPTLTDPTNLDNNPVGDRDTVTLAGVDDASRAEEHRGTHVYRWATERVDLRNLGVR